MRRHLPLLLFAAFVAAEALLLSFAGLDGAQRLFYALTDLTGLPYNTLIVLSGTGLLGLVSGVVGAFAVLRKRAFMGDAVSHAALPGLCLAYMLLRERNFMAFLAGAVLSGVLGVACVSWLRRNTRIKEDAAIGMVLSVFFGAGIALSGIIQRDPTGRQAGLDSYLFGKTAGMVGQDLLSIIVVALNVLAVLVLCYKEFKLLSFDIEFAAVQGWPVFALDLLLMGLIVVTTVIGLPAVGVVLMSALLILPGVSARFWTEKLSVMLGLSAIFGLLTGIAGTWVSSHHASMPAGPVIVLSGAAIFAASMLFAPRRGVLARAFAHLRLEARVAHQNLLRKLYELTEPTLPERPAVPLEAVLPARSWSRLRTWWVLRQAEGREEIALAGSAGLRLTERGVQRAAEVVRSHRLWEIFLVDQAAIAADHVDRDADQIEHVLTPEILALLDERLRAEGRFPAGAMPQSVHPLPQGVAVGKKPG